MLLISRYASLYLLISPHTSSELSLYLRISPPYLSPHLLGARGVRLLGEELELRVRPRRERLGVRDVLRS